jgi:hypothetical protein
MLVIGQLRAEAEMFKELLRLARLRTISLPLQQQLGSLLQKFICYKANGGAIIGVHIGGTSGKQFLVDYIRNIVHVSICQNPGINRLLYTR